MNRGKQFRNHHSPRRDNAPSSINIKNCFIPFDLKSLIPKVDAKDYNFAVIFRYPNIEYEKNKPKIRINDNIDIYKWDVDFLKKISIRLKNNIENLRTTSFNIKNFESTLSWRMVIGLGASHPQETSMTLHHIYGIPYIPGSALKGATRHWIVSDKFNNNEKLALSKDDFKKIFGTQDKQGEVIFFDAYPCGEVTLKIDVMTPHYGPYYSDASGKTPPADFHNPTPIKFLTVEKTKFDFHLASKSNDLLQKAEEWLKEALQNYGLGAKTAIGYGYFETGA